uniref:Putative secreted protein n=1 Tax=Anopheles marajoara TaxID=58244 RepID=A0A2M4CFC5_9DIPT
MQLLLLVCSRLQLPDWSVGLPTSAFNEGRFAGARRADGTLPKLCIPCFRGIVLFCVDGSKDSPRLVM